MQGDMIAWTDSQQFHFHICMAAALLAMLDSLSCSPQLTLPQWWFCSPEEGFRCTRAGRHDSLDS